MATDQHNSKNRKPRSYYVDYSKRRFGGQGDRRRGGGSGGGHFGGNSRFRDAPDLAFGNTGFLITSIDEVKSYLEMRNILEGYFEQLYRDNQKSKPNPGTEAQTVEDEIEAELEQLKVAWPYKQVKTYCKNSLFIRIKPEFQNVDPVIIIDKFFDDMSEQRQLKTTNTFKVLPVLDTIRNAPSCAKESVVNILTSKFGTTIGPKKYFIEFQSRGNYKLSPDDKQKMIEEVADGVSQVKPEWTVSRDEADFMIILISLRNVCCIAIVSNYFQRCKYNVTEFCKDFTQPATLDADRSNDQGLSSASENAEALEQQEGQARVD